MNYVNSSKNRYLWFGISAALLAVLIYISDTAKFISALRSADPYYLALALVLGLSGFLIWGRVWHIFFNQMNIRSNFRETIEMFMAGNFLNSITPLGQFGGEPLMAYIISKNSDASYEKSLSCVVSADIINAVPFVTYLSAGVIYLFLFRSTSSLLNQAIYITVVAGIVGGVLVYLLWFDEEILEKYIFKSLDKIKKVTDHGDKFIKSLKEKVTETKSSFQKAGEDPKTLLKASLIAHTTFITQVASLYFILISIGIAPKLPAMYFTVILAGIATFSPTPGGSGTFEAAFAGIIMFFYSISLANALTAAVLFRLTTYWPGLLIGYLAFIKLNTPNKSEVEEK